jgi:hypothetical protein
MSTLDSLIQSFRELPRAARWAGLAGLAIALFLAWDSFIRPVASDWAAAADDLQRDLATVRSGAELARSFNRRASRQTILAHGPVDLPASKAEAESALSRTVNEVLAEHRVSDTDLNLSWQGNLPKNALPSIARGRKIARLKVELSFESAPEDAIAILAAFESRRDVESVSQVRLTKESGRKLKVRMSLETWALESKGASS